MGNQSNQGHNHSPGHHHVHDTGKNIAVAFFLNLGFTIIEFIGGFMTNSISILSDAVHDLGDSLSLGIAWYFEKVSKKGRDEKFTFGYKRFSILGALITSVILVVGSVFIIYGAIDRLSNPAIVNSKGMILIAILGVIVNGAAVFRLKKGESLNERAVYLHLLEDVLGWVAVLLGAIIIYFTHWYWIDPLLSLFIATFVLYNVYHNLKEAVYIILQGIPSSVDIESVTASLLENINILDVHHLHVWTLDGQRNILTAHLVVNDDAGFDLINELRTEAKLKMTTLGIQHCTFEIENSKLTCCNTCVEN